MPEPKETRILTPWHIVENLEETLKRFVDEPETNKDHIEDFMSYTITAINQLCGVVDAIQGRMPEYDK